MKLTAIPLHAAASGLQRAGHFEVRKRGSFAAAGLDVFENEPVLNPEFVRRKNTELTPPIASGAARWR